MFSFNKSESGSINCADSKDFRKLYDSAMELLFKVSFKIVEDEEAAEDLVHDSFIKANEKAMVFPSINDAVFWLIRVVKNASLNYAKRKVREANAYHKALYESRVRRNNAAAISALRRMDARVASQEVVTAKLLPLAKADSRLGFHSEAEAHQYHPAKLE